jgi:hypothetical protein
MSFIADYGGDFATNSAILYGAGILKQRIKLLAD